MNNILELRNLHVEVENEEILKGVNLSIPDGEVHALLGPNGSGKTSVMMSIMGFSKYRITKGEIIYKGQVINDMDVTERARLGIGIAQQRPPTIEGVKLNRILDYLEKKHPKGKSEIGHLVSTARVRPFLNRNINSGLSGGEIKRSELVQLIAAAPKFAMMDEPESGVDVEAMELIGKLTNALFSPDIQHPAKRTAGLIITHTGNILNYVNVDKAHVLIKGMVACTGNPHIIMDMVSDSGYESCVDCIRQDRSYQIYDRTK